MELRKGPTMSSEQPDLELSETAQQINDLFELGGTFEGH